MEAVATHPAEVGGLTLAELLAAAPDVQVAALERLVGAVTSGDSRSAEPTALADLSVRVARIGHRLQAQRLGWLSAIEADGRWALEAVRTFAHWVAWRHGTSLSTARREVALARTLRDDLPVTAEAARAGTIGPDHVWALASIAATSELRRAALAGAAAPECGVGGDAAGHEDGRATPVDPAEAAGPAQGSAADAHHGGVPAPRTGEHVLVELATQHRVEPFRQVLRHFATLADPEAADRAFADAAAREFVDLSATMGGFHLAGFLTTEHGQAVRTALEAAVGVPAADDRRTAGQRRAQGLADLARDALDRGTVGTGAAVRPHLTVTVSWSELSDLLARTGADRDPVTGEPTDWATLLAEPPARWVDGTGPIPHAVLKRLACDSTVGRVVFGPDSQILNVGRRERTFTGSRRSAVVARDSGCVWPGCHQAPSRCEVHHAITPWASGGETSTDNAALLCWFHHDHVDTTGVAMDRRSGRWRFRRRDGTVIEDG